MLATDKHSSLLLKSVNYGQKSFIKLAPGRRVRTGVRLQASLRHSQVGRILGRSSSAPGTIVIKLFTDAIYECSLVPCYETFYGRKLRIFAISLKVFVLPSLSSIVLCLRVRKEPTQVKHVSCVPL
jgi:hypothetical protein